MDKKSIIGIILIGAILVIFTLWNSPNKKQLAETQRLADSIALVQLKAQEHKTISSKDTSVSPSVTGSKTIEASKTKELKDTYGSFSEATQGKQDFYTLENDLLKITLASKGGRPYSVELKKYKTFDKKPLILFDGDSTVLGMNFYTQNNRTISTNELYFKPTALESNVLVSEKDSSKSLILRMYAGASNYIEYVYTMKPKSYKVDFNINFVKMDSLISSNTTSIDLNWQIYTKAQEQEKTSENKYTDIVYKYSQDEVDKFEISPKETAEKSLNIRNKIKWIAFKQQFFSTVLIANNTFENATFTAKNTSDSSRFLKVFKSEIGLSYQNTSSQKIGMAFYFGPNHYQTLKKFNLDMEELVNLGSWIVKWINRFLIIPIFNFLNQYILNFGIIILFLTFVIKLLLFPLTYKSYLSMAKMRVLKPQIDEINERIPADKAMERQQATMQLYKKVGVSPLGGCLPMLLQLPILLAMFNFFPSSIELRQQGFLWVHDLSTYDSVYSWTTNIPIITSFFGNHISMFNILMTITTILTIRMNNQASASGQQFPGMKAMTYIMPIMFMFILNNFSSGLTYYYFLANMITIVQNEIFKRSIDEEKLLHQLNENKKKIVKKSKFQERLEEAAKRKGYNMKK
jgi:YidC/Oxa1 family membrane protein insertase